MKPIRKPTLTEHLRMHMSKECQEAADLIERQGLALSDLLSVFESRTPDQLGLHPMQAVRLRDRCRAVLEQTVNVKTNVKTG